MINIIVSIIFLLFVTSLTLTLFTIIKHTEKVVPVLEQFKWPLTTIPQADKLDTLVKYEVEKQIADKMISIDDLDNKYNIYFDNDKIKNRFLFDVNNYDFVFYYAKINNNNYYVPNNYVYLNSKTNVKPTGSNYSLGIVLSENKDKNIQSSENINLFDLITHNIDWELKNNNVVTQVINFISPVNKLSYNNFVTGKAIIYNKNQVTGNYTSFNTYFYIDKENIIHILSQEQNNELLKLKETNKYQLENVDDSSNLYIPSMLVLNIGFNITLVKLMMQNPVNFKSNENLLVTIDYYNSVNGTIASATIANHYYTLIYENAIYQYNPQPGYIFFPNSILRNEFNALKSNSDYLRRLKFVEIGVITSSTPPQSILYYIDDEMQQSLDPNVIIGVVQDAN